MAPIRVKLLWRSVARARARLFKCTSYWTPRGRKVIFDARPDVKKKKERKENSQRNEIADGDNWWLGRA